MREHVILQPSVCFLRYRAAYHCSIFLCFLRINEGTWRENNPASIARHAGFRRRRVCFGSRQLQQEPKRMDCAKLRALATYQYSLVLNCRMRGSYTLGRNPGVLAAVCWPKVFALFRPAVVPGPPMLALK